MTPKILGSCLLSLLLLCALPAAAQPSAGGGEVHIVGSGSTVMPIVELWKARFLESHPGVNVDLSGEGTTWGPAALMSGRAHIAAMSRRMTDGELEVFQAKVGSEPVAFPIGLDAVAMAAVVLKACPSAARTTNNLSDFPFYAPGAPRTIGSAFPHV